MAERMKKDNRPSNTDRKNGTVMATFPDRGFFWIRGEDGEKYFAHQSKVRSAYSIYDMWEGQKCTFRPAYVDPRGPAALEIDMSMDRA